ncbi:hypothetical protein RJT34_24700 [Clitoria ternatea]|uniref:Uncharacterized protein n=1 Tax=Clitoria ternatea TaxID=43366 RepID=A0AAN9FNJ4_CLITE
MVNSLHFVQEVIRVIKMKINILVSGNLNTQMQEVDTINVPLQGPILGRRYSLLRMKLKLWLLGYHD